MKNHFLVLIFCLVAIFSLYSVSALYIGTINVSVGNNVNFQVGSSNLSFNVTNTTNTSSSIFTPAGVGGGGGTGVYNPLSLFSTTNGIQNNTSTTNLAGNSANSGSNANLNGNSSVLNSSSSQTSNSPSSITGGVINALGSPAGAGILGVLVLGLIITLVVVARIKSKPPKSAQIKEKKK